MSPSEVSIKTRFIQSKNYRNWNFSKWGFCFCTCENRETLFTITLGLARQMQKSHVLREKHVSARRHENPQFAGSSCPRDVAKFSRGGEHGHPSREIFSTSHLSEAKEMSLSKNKSTMMTKKMSYFPLFSIPSPLEGKDEELLLGFLYCSYRYSGIHLKELPIFPTSISLKKLPGIPEKFLIPFIQATTVYNIFFIVGNLSYYILVIMIFASEVTKIHNFSAIKYEFNVALENI